MGVHQVSSKLLTDTCTGYGGVAGGNAIEHAYTFCQYPEQQFLIELLACYRGFVVEFTSSTHVLLATALTCNEK